MQPFELENEAVTVSIDAENAPSINQEDLLSKMMLLCLENERLQSQV